MDCCKDKLEIHLKSGSYTSDELSKLFGFSELKSNVIIEHVKNNGSCLALSDTQDKITPLTLKLMQNSIPFEVKSAKLVK